MQTFFDDGDQDISRHGNAYLRLHGVFAGTQKGFDTQMLFDPFEKQFDLPALLVKCRDQFGFECEVVGQKRDALSRLVFGNNPSQRRRIVFARLLDRQHTGLIAHDIGRRTIDRMGIPSFELRIAFCPRDKERVPLVHLVEPSEIEIAAIHQIERSWLDSQLVEHVHFVSLAVGDVNEAGNRTAQVEQGMQTNCRFGGTKRRPRIHRQTQVDGGGVEGIYRRIQIDPHRFVDVQRSCHRDQVLREVCINLPRPSSVRVGQRIARNGRAAKAHVIEPVCLRPQIDFDVAQRFSISKLRKCHGEKLIQTGEIFDLVVAAMGCYATTKSSQWQVSHELRENELALMHGSLRRKSAKSAQFAPRC